MVKRPSKTEMNQGKKFEHDFVKSVPEYAMIYRLPDAAQSFGGSNNLRFSHKNPFDFFLFDSRRQILYGIETKTVKGKSISFERTKEENGVIHYHQIQGLHKYNKYDNAVFGFMIEFREIEKTIFIDIESFQTLVDSICKKSFNYGDLENSNIDYYIVSQSKNRTRYKYDIDDFLINYRYKGE